MIPDVITDGLTWVNWWKDSYNGYYNGSKSLLSHIDSTVPYSEAIYQELIRRQADPSLSRTTTLEGDSMFGWAYMESTDWLDLFYKDWNLSHEHNLSISGGTRMPIIMCRAVSTTWTVSTASATNPTRNTICVPRVR
mgnify:CR=1 FL=1